jgi:hypothetical protein
MLLMTRPPSGRKSEVPSYWSLRTRLRDQVEKARERYWTAMERHKLYVSEHGEDIPEVRDWQWNL